MKFLTVIILLVTLVNASLNEIVNTTLTEADGDCFHSRTNHTFKVGTTYNPIGECNTFTCTGNGGYYGLTCAAFHPRPGCTIGEQDLTKPYPECCEPEVC